MKLWRVEYYGSLFHTDSSSDKEQVVYCVAENFEDVFLRVAEKHEKHAIFTSVILVGEESKGTLLGMAEDDHE